MEVSSRALRIRAVCGAALLCSAVGLAYANHFQNAFHFDDAHTIVNNSAIRNIWNIPRFFCDATTFSSLPSNQSYRPLVSTLLAISYSLGGLEPFWFHVAIFALFIALTLLLAFVIQHLGGHASIAIFGAALFALHPANADTVNYIIASSEIMAALGVVSSFALYFILAQHRWRYVCAAPAALAVLAKPTAAIFPVLFAVYYAVFVQPGPRRSRRTFWREITPPFVLCGTVLALVQRMTPPSWVSGAASRHDYLMTQPFATLLYFRTFVWPAGLSADYDLRAVTRIGDPRCATGLAFVALMIAGACYALRFSKTRMIGFGLLWFVLALLPTSLFPLAEVMNDHRTFLPYIGLAISAAGALQLFIPLFAVTTKWKGIVLTCLAAMLLCTSAVATFRRNQVWQSEETLWHDVVEKSPRNGRGLMNYGNTLMARGDFISALDCFHRARVFTPNYSYLLINLAIAESATGDRGAAEEDFKQALRLAPSSPSSYIYYGRFLLEATRRAEALALLQKAVALSPSDVTATELLHEAEAPGDLSADNAEAWLTRSLRLYQQGHYLEAIAACREALAQRPDYAEAWNNIGASYNNLERYDDAVEACEAALRCRPDFELARNNLQYARERQASRRK